MYSYVDNLQAYTHKGHITFADNLETFSQITAVPLFIPHLDQLDQGSGNENTLSTRKAKWHQDCILLFSKTRLDRASEHNEESYKRLTQ